MLLRQVFIGLVLCALIVLYITLPVSHRVLNGWEKNGNKEDNKNQNNNNKKKEHAIQKPRIELTTITSSSSSSNSEENNNDGAKNNNKPTKFPKIIPEQMVPTDFGTVDEKGGEYRNPYKSFLEEFPQVINNKNKNKNISSPHTTKKCNMLKYTRGKWIKRDYPPRPVYPALGEILGCCERGFQKEQQESGSSSSSTDKKGIQQKLRPELFYEWVPDDCDLIPWSEELFCKALRGRDIMFAGDSLNDHWHASLYYLLGGNKDIYKYEGTIQGKKRCKGHPICAKYYKKPLKLHHLTNQYLAEGSLRNRNYKWWRPIRKYPILVLNSGSWMRDVFDEKIAVPDDKWKQLMVKALGLVKREEYNGTIIWRTTYSGHPFCWDHTKPLDAPLRGDQFPDVAPYNKYRWDTIPERNKFTTKLWSDAGAHVLDVERLTGMMPLGHLGKNHPKFAVRNATDCLHYCSPGPVYDTWSQLLMNLLLGNFD
jgi:hypothetical protein